MNTAKVATTVNNNLHDNIHNEILPPKKFFGVRHIQFTLMFLSTFIFYGHRTTLSVAIIAMTEKSPSHPNIPTYPEWNNKDVILSAFFWGYVIPQIGAGQLAKYFGPKWFLVFTMTAGSTVHIMIPFIAAWFGSNAVIGCRAFQGLNQGFLYPLLHNLLSKWTPTPERSVVSGIVYSGSSLGIAISMVFTGSISQSSYGWPAAFYIYGGLGLLMAFLFACFIANTPSSHPSITEEEKSYIENTTFVTKKSKTISSPWKSFATSLPLWAVLVTACGQCWGTFTLMTEIPSYISNIMNFNLTSDSQLSALPYFALYLVTFIIAPLANAIITRKILSIGATRKVFHGIGMIVPAATLFSLGFVQGDQKLLAITLLVVAVGTTGFSSSTSLVNLVDLAPNHAGTMLGITNGTSNIFSILGPLTVQFLGSDKKDLMLWRKVFWISSIIYVACGLFFNLCSSGEIQSWNYSDSNSKKQSVDLGNKTKIKKVSLA